MELQWTTELGLRSQVYVKILLLKKLTLQWKFKEIFLKDKLAPVSKHVTFTFLSQLKMMCPVVSSITNVVYHLSIKQYLALSMCDAQHGTKQMLKSMQSPSEMYDYVRKTNNKTRK